MQVWGVPSKIRNASDAPNLNITSLCLWLQELQRKVKEMNEQLQINASRRKHIAEALSGRVPDQAKTTEQMQEDLKAAAHLKVDILS